jgi:serine phosphatase RsbU (regulator of sigma subunit)
MESAARAGSEPGEARSQRYLELLGTAADVFLQERDFDASLVRISGLLLAEGNEWLTIYRPSADGAFEATAVVHEDPRLAATALQFLRTRPIGNERYLELVAATRESLVVSEIDISWAIGTTTNPEYLALLRAAHQSAMMLVPIVGRDETWGILQFLSGPQRRRFEEADLAFARDLGKLAAIALDNAWLVDRAETALDELRFLAEVGETMVETLDLATRLDRFVNAVVPRLADWASVNLLEDDGSIETHAIAHRDPALAEVVERLRGPFYANIEHNDGTGNVLRTGRSRLMTGVDESFLRRHIRPDVFDDVIVLGADSALTVPLIAHGRTYGSLAAMRTERERPFLERDIRLIEELARRAAVAIANAKLFERSSTVADAFQQAQLPGKLPRVPGIVLSAFYAAGRREATIGGDWYDAFTLTDGRVVISIGDVSGSGLRAAVIMGSVRQMIRGAAQLQADPSAMLDAVDRALRVEHPDAIVTAFVGVIEPGERRITYASAGHPPPLLRTESGEITELATVGLPLGLRGPGSRTTTQPCGPGSFLLLYTDGLTESTRDILEGERRVREALRDVRLVRSSEAARALHDAILKDGAHDDVALLGLSFV